MATGWTTAIWLLAGWAVGCAFLIASYWRAGPVWIERHSLKFTMAGKPARCSGAVGEIAVLAYCALLLWIVDAITPTWSFLDIIAKRPWVALVSLVFVSGLVAFHTMRTVDHADATVKKRLRDTYAIYSVYSALLFGMGMILIYTIVSQFWFDTAAFNKDGAEIVGHLRHAASLSPRSGYEAVEFAYVDAMKLLKRAEDQMSPVFIFAIAIFVLNLLILYTPLRGLYVDGAVFMTNVSTLIAICAIGIAGGVVYVVSYSAFLDRFLEVFEALPRTIFEADPMFTRRFGDIALSLDEQKSLIGFIGKMSHEWGGLTAIVGVVQGAAARLARNPEIEKSLEARVFKLGEEAGEEEEAAKEKGGAKPRAAE